MIRITLFYNSVVFFLEVHPKIYSKFWVIVYSELVALNLIL
mgnify:CR=1 FL=1